MVVADSLLVTRLKAHVNAAAVEADVHCFMSVNRIWFLASCLIIPTVDVVKAYLAYYSDEQFIHYRYRGFYYCIWLLCLFNIQLLPSLESEFSVSLSEAGCWSS